MLNNTKSVDRDTAGQRRFTAVGSSMVFSKPSARQEIVRSDQSFDGLESATVDMADLELFRRSTAGKESVPETQNNDYDDVVHYD